MEFWNFSPHDVPLDSRLYQHSKRSLFLTFPSAPLSASRPRHLIIKQGCPLSPYLFIMVLSALTADLNEIFVTLFHYTPWTFSCLHPSSDIEYADYNVLMARSNETFMRLLHLLQHLASRIGLLLNGNKCQLLSIHSTLPVSLSLAVTPDSSCDCSFCAPFCGLESNPNSPSTPLPTPLPPLPSAKYLGSFITPNSSSNSDVSFRCSQASHDFNWLDPFFRHTLIFPRRKLQVYPKLSSLFSSMAQSPKPTHQLQSLVLIPSIIRPFDKSFRLKVPTTTEFSIPLMLLAQINFFYHLPTLSFPPFILLPLKFRTVEFSISVTCLDIPIVPSHLFALTPLGPYAPLVPLLGEAPQGLIGLNSPWLKPTINPDYTELHLLTLVHSPPSIPALP